MKVESIVKAVGEDAGTCSVAPRFASVEGKVSGLNSIRFICALWVFFGHGAQPPLEGIFNRHSTVGLFLAGLYNNLWVGPAAVIIFFVVSGFCIHHPYADSLRRPNLAAFYARRFIRLLIPVAIAVPLGAVVNVQLQLFNDSILWSLLAELIYYVLYPALRVLRVRLGSWNPLLIVSFAASYAVVLTDPHAGNYPSYGPSLNWLLGFPCWILGCALAESTRSSEQVHVTAGAIWSWRSLLFAAAWVCSALRFHSAIGFPWTLNLFALLAAAWLRREIFYHRRISASAWIEWAGEWSYSLYLVHLIAAASFVLFLPHVGEPWLRWLIFCPFVLASSYVFYLLVERPSHAAARRVARVLQRP